MGCVSTLYSRSWSYFAVLCSRTLHGVADRPSVTSVLMGYVALAWLLVHSGTSWWIFINLCVRFHDRSGPYLPLVRVRFDINRLRKSRTTSGEFNRDSTVTGEWILNIWDSTLPTLRSIGYSNCSKVHVDNDFESLLGMQHPENSTTIQPWPVNGSWILIFHTTYTS